MTRTGILVRYNHETGYAVLQNFSASGLAGREPANRLVQGRDGTLYGSAYHGGPTNLNGGVLFELSTNGDFTVARSFGLAPGDGLYPSGPLLSLAANGWYGVTEGGGDLAAGTLYCMSAFPPVITSQPRDQSVLAGATANFSAGTMGDPTFFQWFFNGSPIIGANNLILTLPEVGRTNAGVYTLLVTNNFGSVLSSNATLSVQVPLQLSSPAILSDGVFQLVAAYSDGWPLTTGDLARFEAEGSTNLVNWIAVSDALSVSNGVLILKDPATTNFPVRFYRLVEQP